LPCGPLLLACCSFVDLLAAVLALADAQLDHPPVPLALFDPDARRPVAHRADDHDVSDRKRCRLLDDTARRHSSCAHATRVLNRARLGVSLDDVEVLDDDLAVPRPRVDDASLLAAVLAAEDVDEIALAYSHGVSHQRTSGAR